MNLFRKKQLDTGIATKDRNIYHKNLMNGEIVSGNKHSYIEIIHRDINNKKDEIKQRIKELEDYIIEVNESHIVSSGDNVSREDALLLIRKARNKVQQLESELRTIPSNTGNMSLETLAYRLDSQDISSRVMDLYRILDIKINEAMGVLNQINHCCNNTNETSKQSILAFKNIILPDVKHQMIKLQKNELKKLKDQFYKELEKEEVKNETQKKFNELSESIL